MSADLVQLLSSGLSKLKLVEPPVKNEFIDAEIKDPLKKITKLNMVATMYRSLLSAVIMAGFTGLWIVVRTYIPVIKTLENTVIIILLVICLLSHIENRQTMLVIE